MNLQAQRMVVCQRKGMDMTRKSILIAVLFLGAGFAFQAGADADHRQLAKNEAKPAAAASAAWTEGEVRKVDKAAGTVTIKHGAMPKFDMPPMTMAYRVKDKAMLDQLKPGDKIKFDADGVGGEFTVLRLEKVK
jgi:Cu(I)/Ag(I) efflux system periplasmic protein CusF